MKKRIIIAVNSTWNLINFRIGLIQGLLNAGYEVVALSPTDEYVPRLKELGCRHVHLKIDSQSKHIVEELLLFLRFRRLLKKHMPDIFLGFTVKPNIYGSIAAQSLGIPVINNIAGLGSVFVKASWLSHLVRALYRLALLRSDKIFFQNKDDRLEFIGQGVVKTHLTDQLPGSGVDLDHFVYTPIITPDVSSKISYEQKQIRFLLIARMLWEKGVSEYIEAARLLSRQYPCAEFCLLGFLDVQNPEAISKDQMNEWAAEGIVQYLGMSDDVRIEIIKADCIVLPSFYREGVPHVLLESAAMGRPIITTDSVGCREVVDDGINGYLCLPRNAIDLSEKMESMLKIDYEQRAKMGKCGREKVEREFDEQIVIQKYLAAVKESLLV